MYYLCIENKGADQLCGSLISCAVTTQLICSFVFAYSKTKFSHDMAHLLTFLSFLFFCRYAARFDCGCRYKITIKFLDEKKQLLDSYEFEDSKGSGRNWFQVRQIKGVLHNLFLAHLSRRLMVSL